MKLRTKILFGHGLNLILMSIIVGVAFSRINNLIDTSQWVTHTHEVISHAHHIEKLLVDLETGQRGFLITGQEQFLEPYHSAKNAYTQSIRDLQILVSDNPPQVETCHKIDDMIRKWFKDSGNPEIEERRRVNRGESSMEKVSDLVAAETGKSIVDETRGILIDFINVEQDLLIDRQKAAEDEAAQVTNVLLFGVLSIIAMGVIVSYFTSNGVVKQVGGEPTEIAGITDSISKGDFSFQLQEKEYTGIFKSVAAMAGSLQKQRRELEQVHKNLEIRVEERTRALKSSNERLEQFAYAASHDLREPLRTISGFSDILSNKLESVDDDTKKYLNFMKEAAMRMSSLVEDLLVYSRIGRSGKVENVDLNDLVSNILIDISKLIKETDANIECEDLPTLIIDKVAVNHIFYNLISNAIKYRGDNDPVVKISVEESKGKWKFCVEDNGMGIDPKYHQQIFGLFTRLGSRDGTGAGLAIAKKSAEALGGDLWVNSSEGGGSKFYFSILEKKT